MKEQNMENILKALGNIEITKEEKQSIEWLCGWEKSTITNICNVIEKTKKRGAGRKKTVNAEKIQELRAKGRTQEQVARELNISISTVKRNEKK